MAKDKDIGDIPNPGDDLNFDDFGFEGGINDPTSRKPVEGKARGAMKFSAKLGAATVKEIAKRIGKDMPNTTALVEEGFSTYNEIKIISKEVKEQAGLIAQEAKKTIKPFLPQAKKILPKHLYDKLEEAIQHDSDFSGFKTPSKEAQRDQIVLGALGELIAKQTTATGAIAEEERVHRLFDYAKKEEHHKASMVSDQEIKHELQLTNAFLNSSVISYMKKNLELQYRILFTAQDSLEVAKIQSGLMNEQLPRISHNTALPDAQKIYLSEIWKDIRNRRAVEFMSDKIRSFIPKALQFTKQRIVENSTSIRNGLQELSLSSDLSSLLDEDQRKEMALKGGTGLLGMLASGPLAEKLRPYLGTLPTDLERTSANAKEKAFRHAKKFRDEQAGSASFGKGLLTSFLDATVPFEDRNVYHEKEAAKDPFKPVHLDISMREAWVTIIPGYLSKILKQVSDIATGQDNEEQFYDTKLGNFDSASNVFERAKTSAFKSEEAAWRINKSLGRMRGRFELVAPSSMSKQTFDDQIENIRTVIFNINKNRLLFEVDKFLKFKKDKRKEDYIKKVYTGITDPHAVNEIIVAMVAPNGKIDDKAVADFENWILEADASEIHLKNLKETMDMPGMARLFDDKGIIEDREGIRSKFNMSWLDKGQLNNRASKSDERRTILFRQGDYLRQQKEYEQARRAIKPLYDKNYDPSSESDELYNKIDKQYSELRDELSVLEMSEQEAREAKKERTKTASPQPRKPSVRTAAFTEEGVKPVVASLAEILTTTSPIEALVTTTNDILRSGFDMISNWIDNHDPSSPPSSPGSSGGGEPQDNPVLNEINNTLTMHTSKSAHDRQMMLTAIKDIQMFNYHQGDPKQARSILPVVEKAVNMMGGKWGIAKFGIKSLLVPTSLTAKVAMGLGAMGPMAAFKTVSLLATIASRKKNTKGKPAKEAPPKITEDTPEDVYTRIKEEYEKNKDNMAPGLRKEYERNIAEYEKKNKPSKTDPLKSAGKSMFNMLGMNTSLNAGIMGAAGGGWNLLKNVGEHFKEKLADEGGWIGTDPHKKDEKNEQTDLLSNINKGIADLVKDAKKDDGDKDTDGDGIADKRKFGWGRLKKKEKQPKGKGGVVGAGVAGVAAGGAAKGKSDSGESPLLNFVGDKLSDVVTDKFGSKFSKLLGKSKYGARLLSFLGIGGEAAAGAGGLGLMGTLTAGVGTLGAGTVALAGAVAGGVGAGIGLGINKITQHYGGVKNLGSKLLSMRKDKYAIRVNGKVSAVKDFFAGSTRDWTSDLEMAILSDVEKGRPVTLKDSTKLDFISKLGWDLDDNTRAYFSSWFSGRFVPVFKGYIEVLKAMGLDYYSVNNTDDKLIATRLEEAIKRIPVPNPKLVLDDFKLKATRAKNQTWVDPVTGQLMQGERPSEEVLQAKQDEYENKRNESLGGEEREAWWKKSPLQFIKDKMAEKKDVKSLEDVAYDAQYKFTGDEAKLIEKAKAWIKGHEGLRLNEYKDSRGFSTIGYGHLNKEGYTKLSKEEADKLFDIDFDKHYGEAAKIPEFNSLDPVRRMALLNLVFNMGRGGVMKFAKTRALLASGQFPEAAVNLLQSAYARQVGERSKEVAAVLKSGNEKDIKPRAVGLSKAEKASLDEKTLTDLKQEKYRADDYMQQPAPASPAEVMKQQSDVASATKTDTSPAAPAGIGQSSTGMVAIKAAAPPEVDKHLPGAKSVEADKETAAAPKEVKVTGKAAEKSKEAPATPLAVKVETNNKDVVDETAKTNALLTQLIGIFDPIAKHLSKGGPQQAAMASAAANSMASMKQGPTTIQTAPIAETRRR